MVGMFVSLCLASKKPSEREFFVPAGTDLGVKLLNDHEARFISWRIYAPLVVKLVMGTITKSVVH